MYEKPFIVKWTEAVKLKKAVDIDEIAFGQIDVIMAAMDALASLLPYIQILLGVILVASVLLQQTGAGLGGAFGGSDDFSSFHTRRGLEKILFQTTIIVAILFVASSFLALILR